MNQRSRSTLFLIEQLIVVAVFAICGAACVSILTSAYLTARDSKDIVNAISVAESGAESYKATGGDMIKAVEMLGGGAISNSDGAYEAIIYYDRQWHICAIDEAFYAFRIIRNGPENRPTSLITDKILVEKLTGETLITFNVAANPP
ncbi:MAG: hypothetical protein FWH57_00955 [Oscillospiraceae bacterium]|nr:hypothetical protein [Oscillospiraceae bacterium]